MPNEAKPQPAAWQGRGDEGGSDTPPCSGYLDVCLTLVAMTGIDGCMRAGHVKGGVSMSGKDCYRVYAGNNVDGAHTVRSPILGRWCTRSQLPPPLGARRLVSRAAGSGVSVATLDSDAQLGAS